MDGITEGLLLSMEQGKGGCVDFSNLPTLIIAGTDNARG